MAYYSNCTASFSPVAVTLVRGGDIQPQPGPIGQRNESAKLDIPNALKANVKLAHLNVWSLKARENFCLVNDTILQNGFDIFTIPETWADLTASDASLEIPGYQLFRQDRGQHKAGGGLCIYAKSCLKITVLEDLSSAYDDGFQQLWLKVQCRSFKSFLICNTYRPPQTPTTCFESLSNSLTDALLLDLDIFVLGDLNCNLLGSSSEATSLTDFTSTFNLHQLIEKPTRITETTKSLIDVIMTTNVNVVTLSDAVACSISDHRLVYVAMALKTPRLKPSYVTIRSYPKYNAKRFCEDLALVPFHMTYMFDDFDDQVETFNALFTDILNDHAPIKRVKIKSRPNPFVTTEIRQLMKTRDRWHKRANKSNDVWHWNAYRFFRQEVNRELRIAEKVHVRTQLLQSKENTNAIWKTINNCLPKKSKTRPRIPDNPVSLDNRFNEYFTSVGRSAAQKANDLVREHNFHIDPTMSTVVSIPDEMSDLFQFPLCDRERC